MLWSSLHLVFLISDKNVLRFGCTLLLRIAKYRIRLNQGFIRILFSIQTAEDYCGKKDILAIDHTLVSFIDGD